MRFFKLITGLAIAAVIAISVPGLVNVSADCGGCGAGHDHAKQTHAIYPTAREAGFKTLSAAIEAAGLDEVLTDNGPFTVFAPTNEAFSKIPEETLNGLLADPEALASVLTYHVVPGKVMAADVVTLTEATTLNGEVVKIDTTQGVMINDAKVVATDIEAGNGVIHVIDTVLLPPQN